MTRRFDPTVELFINPDFKGQFREFWTSIMGKAANFETEHAKRVRMKPVAFKPNLRNQQRVDVSADVTIERKDGSCLTCKIANLSRTGIMISCNQALVKELVPSQRAPIPGSVIPVTAKFSVPVVPTQPVSVIAEGSIVHMRRIARDEFHIGIQFAEFEGNGYDYVDRYVSKLLSGSDNCS